MTHATIARFQARRNFQSQWERHAPTQAAVLSVCAPDPECVRALGMVNAVNWGAHVMQETIDTRIGEFTALYDQKRVDTMWNNCRHEVIHSIANTFGLGQVAGALDKTGGNVDTVHNVRQGIYATQAEQQKFEDRGDYNSADFHAHKDYRDTNNRYGEMLGDGTLVDAYTGQTFHPAAKKDEQRKPNLDHVVAASNIHNDAGRVLADLDAPTLANSDANLTPTSASINKAKKAKTAAEFTHYLKTQAPARQARIHELEAIGAARTDQERKQLAKLQQLNQVDTQRMAQKEAAAKADIDKKVNTSYYTSAKFVGNLTATSAAEGVKTGMQQAMGAILVEFFAATFDEITDWAKHGRRQATLLGEIKTRLLTVAKRCEGKLQAAMTAFKQGSVSGFFSNLVTALINTFLTTTKRIGRMVREGFNSLVQSIQMLLFPPKGMSYRETTHEASKTLLTGGFVIGAIAVEEWLEKQLVMIPLLASIASSVVPVIVGALTALVTTLGVYLIDQADMLGVMRAKRLAGTTALIDESIDSMEARLKELSTSYL